MHAWRTSWAGWPSGIYKAYRTYKQSKIKTICKFIKYVFISFLKMKCSTPFVVCLGNIENIVFVMLVQIRSWDGSYRIEQTKLVCAISRKLFLG